VVKRYTYLYCGKIILKLLKKLKLELPYDPTILPVGIYSRRDVCIPILPPVTIAKGRNQPKCSVEGLIRKGDVDTQYYSALKKKLFLFATVWME
jgi:hypothetical protein